ncbi:hypothetical protein SRHO_G00144170 [Serrasalmus rhombeus]
MVTTVQAGTPTSLQSMPLSGAMDWSTMDAVSSTAEEGLPTLPRALENISQPPLGSTPSSLALENATETVQDS